MIERLIALYVGNNKLCSCARLHAPLQFRQRQEFDLQWMPVPENPRLHLMDDTEHGQRLEQLLRQAKELAVHYYQLTGKPLGVTGEVAELEAAQKLGLRLAPARTPFYDAYRQDADRRETFQVKGRAVTADDRYRGRVPKINCGDGFDAVLLVLLDKASFEAIEIWRAERTAVIARLTAPGSKARNERHSMGIAQFKSIPGAQRVWPI